MSEPMPESPEHVAYKQLLAQKEMLDNDLRIITQVYGKVTASHDYKEFAAKTNQLMQKVQSKVKEITAKIQQWDNHFKAQQAYNEMLKNEEVVTELWNKYL